MENNRWLHVLLWILFLLIAGVIVLYFISTPSSFANLIGALSLTNLLSNGVIVAILLGIVFLVFYFIPALVASHRHKKNKTAIAIFNLFLGWTFVGWVAALVWAFTVDE
ncbi:MAG: hypothetical protein A3A33_02450 [Candidatus Yanofskybacteria bacterium RIFCSPLOWO2_01_FULL_49_25]|uniref:Superinfection immunity protein n=1 Tax=Candidatus Yanofskybacteria bacterium RIFCSPLOWO2_01_FULL_49_25 TaxID=1802701 RepID=A0A1F8GS42_9BACT|nr:MAG: hypothetical protein A3A33_02450 [Candidatus Yanofskybacteria bacterium RIFCSPLOWO2_01_FULL_49_25]